jgi:addiction module RelE/StbE family toxin
LIKFMDINYTATFKRSLKKYKQFHLVIISKINLFRQNLRDPSLKVHKLSGKLSNMYAFSINYDLRVIFKFEDDKSITFLDIGTHSLYH